MGLVRRIHLTRAYHPTAAEEEARQRALELAGRRGWTDSRILASTGRFGYCAIAVIASFPCVTPVMTSLFAPEPVRLKISRVRSDTTSLSEGVLGCLRSGKIFASMLDRSGLASAGQAAVSITCAPTRPMCCVFGSTLGRKKKRLMS